MGPTRRTLRLAALLTLLVLGVGPWLTVVGAALYLRSPVYRAGLEERLTLFFGLPTRVGRIVPLSWHEMQLQDIEVFLPDSSDKLAQENRVAYCRLAEWRHGPVKGQFDLLLDAGTLDLTPARWAKGDFSRLEKSLRHDYPGLNLNKVGVYRSSVRWACEDFSIDLGEAEGVISFESLNGKTEGLARFSAGRVNGEPAAVAVQARFDPRVEANHDPHNGGLVHEFTLVTSPNRPAPIPARQFHLDRLLGGPVTQGQFVGRLEYKASQDGRRNVFTISDSELTGVQLGEFTRGLPGGAVSGLLKVKVDELAIEQAPPADAPEGGPRYFLSRLRFSGVVSDLDLGPAMAALGLKPCEGKARLQVEEASLEPDRPIRRLRATASVEDLDLAQWSALLQDRLGDGRVRGAARIDSAKLLIADGKLVEFQADLTGDTSAGGPAGGRRDRAVVDMKLIEALAPALTKLKSLHVSLPDAIPYCSLKVQAASDGDKLVILGQGGSDTRSMMTLLIPTPSWTRIVGPDSVDVDVPSPGYDKPFDLSGLARRLARPVKPIPLRAVGRTIRQILPPRVPPRP